MQLDIVADKEVVKVGDAEIYVGYLDPVEYTELQNKYQSKGKISEENAIKLNFEILNRTIKGWKNIKDRNGKEIPFKTELINTIVTALMKEDKEILEKLIKAGMALILSMENEKKKLKNS